MVQWHSTYFNDYIQQIDDVHAQLQQLEGTNHNEEGPNDDDELCVMESKIMIVEMVPLES